MDEDYDPMAGDPEQDEDDDDFVQGGPDLFGAAAPVVAEQGEALLDEPTPSDDVEERSDDQGEDVLIGPETPEEPDGLDSEEDAEPEEAGDLDDVVVTDQPSVPEEGAAPGEDADGSESEVSQAGPAEDPTASDPVPEGAEPTASGQIVQPRDLPDGETPEPPLALYRRYRPETFDEVIGQEHVTEPLKRAIINNRVNHAYLFSGPRGCGKTTSARILARALNCEKGPTPTPCGVCQSCRDLARGGPGSIDVIEIDAASHGGVEDARDLRERAFFSPVSSRYKIYIIDEAHMVTTQGFNALLKLVEEPPPHVKFIFATTEPEKVIGTIRSRTHHYPFRLVPPKTLVAYLETICQKEGIRVDRAVLPLVVRAGGGSVRDSLSVLDQLLGGAEADGVSYERAAALLGYTPDALLDEIVDAFAAGDAHEVFATIDKVIEIGQDPRRFAEDLLRRVRDLVILSAVPDACSTGLIDASPEQATRLSHQAAGMGSGELTRAAEVLATGLTQMRGTTAPRLHLELMCSRVLLPGADAGDRGYNARLDRLERRLGIGEGAAGDEPVQQAPVSGPQGERLGRQDGGSGVGAGRRSAAPGPGNAPGPVADAPRSAVSRDGGGQVSDRSPGAPGHQPPSSTVPRPATQQDPSQRSQRPAATGPRRRPRPSERNYQSGAGQSSPQPSVGQPAARQQETGRQDAASRTPSQQAPAPSQPSAAQPPAGAPGGQVGTGQTGAGQVDISMLRREWPRVLDVVKGHGRVIWMVLTQYAQVLEVHGREATIGFANPGAREMFLSGPHPQALHDAVMEVLGADLIFTPVLGGQGAAPAGPTASGPSGPQPGRGPAAPPQDQGPWREPPPDPSEPGRDGAIRPGGGEPDAHGSPSTAAGAAADVPAAPSSPAPPVRGGGASGPADGSRPGDGLAPGVPAASVGLPSGSSPASGASSAASGPSPAASADSPSDPDAVAAEPIGAGAGDPGRTVTHRWSERAKEGIRAMTHRVEEPPAEEEPPPEDWESEVVEEPQVPAAELIRTELGGVVINDLPTA